MRRNKDFEVFAVHSAWYTKDQNGFYIPTSKAPQEAVEAIKRANERLAWERKQKAYY